MKTRKFKNIEVSAIGLGCMGFTHAYGEGPSEKDGIHLVHYAFEKGCRLFDTAEMYSSLKNEALDKIVIHGDRSGKDIAKLDAVPKTAIPKN